MTKAHSRIIWSVSWAPDGRFLATGSRDNTVKLWRVSDTGERKQAKLSDPYRDMLSEQTRISMVLIPLCNLAENPSKVPAYTRRPGREGCREAQLSCSRHRSRLCWPGSGGPSSVGAATGRKLSAGSWPGKWRCADLVTGAAISCVQRRHTPGAVASR